MGPTRSSSPFKSRWAGVCFAFLAAGLILSWLGELPGQAQIPPSAPPSATAEEASGGQGSPFGPLSLLPAAITIVLAYATRQVLLALFLGIVSGSVIVFFGSLSGSESIPWADLNFLEKFFLPALGSKSYATILLVYLWFLGGILGVWNKTGGARYFAEHVGARLAKGPRGSKLFAWIVGCIFHQGGTVSTVLAGTTVRPVSDRHRVSHEELSYIVDSTASPVATIIPFNAWPLFIGSLVVGATTPALGGYALVSTEEEGVQWFFRSIPFNFYAIFAVLFTFLLSLDLLPWTGGRMKAAIRRSRETGKLDADDAAPLLDPEALEGSRHPGYPTGLIDFFLPLGILFGVALIPWLISGSIPIGEAFLSCTLSAMILAKVKGMPLKTVLEGFIDGCKSMTLGAIILGMAVTLKAVSDELQTADFLITLVDKIIWPPILPLLLTGLCMIVAFSIGTSWGTYAVIFPLAIPLALKLAISSHGLEGEPVAALASTHPAEWASILLYMKVCFGAVLGGSVFGDQCSPISDTTILSSMFTGCDLMDHVKTQLPLALVAAGLGAIASTLVVLIF